MKLSDLLKNSNIEYTLSGDGEVDVCDITFDSRKAACGVMFVCLVGSASDGHDFAESAYSNGCRIFAVCKEIKLPSDAIIITVENTRKALPHIAACFFERPADKMKIIGVTGTKGKTSIACMISSCLNSCGIKCGNIGTSGIEYNGLHFKATNTTPESLELHRILRNMLDAGVDTCVMEVSSQALFNYRVDGINFFIGIYTNLSPDHIGPTEHPTFDHYKNCKKRLFSLCRYGILNMDDPYFTDMSSDAKCEIITYGLSSGADFAAENILPYKQANTLGMSFDALIFKKRKAVTLPFPGKFSILNALAALAVCEKMSVDIYKVIKCLETIRIPGRFESVPMFDDRLFVIDYAHNEGSMRNLLESVKAYNPKRMVVLFGSIGDRTQNRRAGLGSACNEFSDFSIITSDNPGCEDPEKIINEIANYFSSDSEYVKIPDRDTAIRYAVNNSLPGDVVLLCGKGHEDYQLVGKEKVPFCERDILLDEYSKIKG